MRRIVREAAQDDAAEGSRWLEIQVDPTSYAPFLGGHHPGAGDRAGRGPGRLRGHRHRRRRRRRGRRGCGTRWTRARWPGWPPATPARGRATVVGFGLSNDERRGRTGDFAHAFDIARRAGLACVPHGGELLGAGRASRRPSTALRPGPARPRRPQRRGPRGAGRGRAPGRHPGGLPRQQRRPGGLPRPGRRAAAPAAGGRRPGGPRRRRPAAVRLAAGRAVRVGAHGAGAGRRRAGGPGPRVGARLAGAGGAAQDPARRHRRLAGRLRPAPDPPRRPVAPPCRRPAPYAASERGADQDRLVDQGDPERVLHAVADLAGQGQRRRRRVAPPRLVRARVCLVDRAAGPGMP